MTRASQSDISDCSSFLSWSDWWHSIGLNMMSLAQEDTFKSCKSNNWLNTEVESVVGLLSGLAQDCLNLFACLIWCTISSHTWDKRQISFSSYSIMETNELSKNAGTIVDKYGDIFQYSELKKRPRYNVLSCGSMCYSMKFSTMRVFCVCFAILRSYLLILSKPTILLIWSLSLW